MNDNMNMGCTEGVMTREFSLKSGDAKVIGLLDPPEERCIDVVSVVGVSIWGKI